MWKKEKNEMYKRFGGTFPESHTLFVSELLAIYVSKTLRDLAQNYFIKKYI